MEIYLRPLTHQPSSAGLEPGELIVKAKPRAKDMITADRKGFFFLHHQRFVRRLNVCLTGSFQ